MMRAAMRLARWVPAAPVFLGLLACWLLAEAAIWLGLRLDAVCRRIVGMPPYRARRREAGPLVEWRTPMDCRCTELPVMEGAASGAPTGGAGGGA